MSHVHFHVKVFFLSNWCCIVILFRFRSQQLDFYQQNAGCVYRQLYDLILYSAHC